MGRKTHIRRKGIPLSLLDAPDEDRATRRLARPISELLKGNELNDEPQEDGSSGFCK
jgi:hypothetical protein